MVVKGAGIVKELGFVNQLGDRLQHRGREFHAHAQVYRVARQSEAQVFGSCLQPGCPFPPWGHDHRPGFDTLAALGFDTRHLAVAGQDAGYRHPGANRHVAAQQFIPHAAHNLGTALGADVAYGDRDKAQAGQRRLFLQGLDLVRELAIDRAGRAKTDVSLIHLFEQPEGLILAQDLSQVAAHGRG